MAGANLRQPESLDHPQRHGKVAKPLRTGASDPASGVAPSAFGGAKTDNAAGGALGTFDESKVLLWAFL